MQEMMKAIVATGYGVPDVLQLQQVAKPAPKENEVLVKIYASTVTTADAMMRTGTPYFGRLFTGISKPKHPIPGTGFAGVVEAIGNKVTAFQPGDEVFGETTLGASTNAEFVSIPETGVILPKPENLGFNEAATLTDGPLTSYNFLKEVAKVQAGQKVLINGASGSLGTAAVQIAKTLGAHVTGVCSHRNVGAVKALGADEVIDYTRKDFTQSNETYNFIFDTIGKSSFTKCKNILTETGEYLSPVMKFSVLFDMMRTSVSGKKKAKFRATGLLKDHELCEQLSEVVELFKEGKLKVVIDRQYPLEKVAEAHTYVASGHKKGNVVIIVQP